MKDVAIVIEAIGNQAINFPLGNAEKLIPEVMPQLRV